MAVVAVLAPGEALAWGPGVHLALGNTVLAHLGCLPPLLGGLLSHHREAFLYGCLSADIFIGKGTEFNPGHSHNWVTGLKLLNSASGPHVTAYAYGYLTHLAADVVAHNYYVPNTLWTMPSGGKLSHVYVEAQADNRFQAERESALALFRRPNRDTDRTLLTAMDKGRLPFLLKKQIVKGSLRLARSKEWSRSLRLADRLLPWPASDDHLDKMYDLSRRVVFDLLSDQKQTVAYTFDPIGSRNLRLVREMRAAHPRARTKASLFVPHVHLTALPELWTGTGQAVSAIG
ncbi:zinc dependent phospholipase C family protein [Pseudodesulfovibrio cashew]|uniref:zinc dependent phospholipase C family protein n=1 Tax=Pseudodesulfovibrio cashew TaxID=2678688 RepID=UPI001F5521FE|nr:zinc dependent phospholipase C family protein [Pseudodesulfovibrio cashew]